MKKIFMGCFLLVLAMQGNTQVNREKLAKKITVEQGSVRIDSLLKIFSRQTGIEFSFNSRKIPPSKTIHVKTGVNSLEAWLQYLQQSIDIQYKIVGSHIILFDHHVPGTEKKSGKNAGTTVPSGASSSISSSAPVQVTTPSTSYAMRGNNEEDTGRQPRTNIQQDPLLQESRQHTIVFYDPASRQYVSYKFQNAHKKTQEAATAQKLLNDGSGEGLIPLTRLDLALQGIGAGFERRLGKSCLLDLALGMSVGGYNINSGSMEYNWIPSEPAFYVSFTPRFFYNLHKREEQGRSTRMNSGNFIGLRLKYTTRSIVENTNIYDAILLNVHWGMQRSLGARWSFATHFGIGYAIDATDLQNTGGTWYPAIDLRFSRILSRQRQ
jgi:hypothetical protein